MNDWYRDYLKSDEYQIRRYKRLLLCETIDFPPSIRCEHLDCGLYIPLSRIQVHHLTYKSIGNEQPEDLVAYCRSCHAASHGYPRPIWWRAAKQQGLTVLTEQFYRQYGRLKLVGEVMFECLEHAPQERMALTMHGIAKSLEEDAKKYPVASAV